MFEWNERKNKQNVVKHGIDFSDAEQVFLNSECVTIRDVRVDYGEERFVTLGLLASRVVVIAHTQRGDKTRIISMRKANEREQKYYQKRFETDR